MSEIENIYIKLQEKGIINPEKLKEKQLYIILKSLGFKRDVDYIKAFGGKEKYDNILRICQDGVKNIKINRGIIKKNISKKAYKLLIKVVAIGTLIGGIALFNSKYDKVTVVVDENDTVFGIIDEWTPEDEIAKIMSKIRVFAIGNGSHIEPFSRLESDNPNSRIKIYVPEDKVDDVAKHNEDLGYVPQHFTTEVATEEEQKEIVGYVVYTVIAGDTLTMIAEGFDTSIDDIHSANQINGSEIYQNQKLKIPVRSKKQIVNGKYFEQVEIPEMLIKLLDEIEKQNSQTKIR